MRREIEVTSIGDIVAAIKEVNGLYDGTVWFRGQGDKEWPLLPGFLRDEPKVSETTLLNRFKQSAAMLAGMLPDEVVPENWTAS
ncbi:MAG: hypothetical protein GY767_07555 [Shimia sp.]|nr:hypothetical protein [Shimia sp.]